MHFNSIYSTYITLFFFFFNPSIWLLQSKLKLDLNKQIELQRMFEIQKKVNKGSWENQWREDARRGRWKREKGGGPSIFIAKTFEILENDQHSDIVSWNQDGTNFTILDVERFEQEILPAYFRHRNFSSFVRQLNMYDFHKIRNEQNKSIFQHREFRRNARQLLKNIRRKGCTSKKINDQVDDFGEDQDSPYEAYEDISQKQDTIRPTLASIENRSQISIPKPTENPYKSQLIEDFISSLPQIVESQQQIREIIKCMKKDSRYRLLNSKQDVRKIVRRIRSNNMVQRQQDLDELSIEEEIMVLNVDQREQRHPTLTVLSSDNFLPQRTLPFICSLILFEDMPFNKH